VTGDDGKIRLLIELTIAPEKWEDLNWYKALAVQDGWADDPENGVWYLAEEICNEHSRPLSGVKLEIVP
jgi:hypothetical protein